MSAYLTAQEHLRSDPKVWLVTGCAGFIGSNLVEMLLSLGQTVKGLDNFATGHRSNLEEVSKAVSPEQWARFHFEEGDITSLDDCLAATAGVDFVLHQAALGSVPRSIADPIATNSTNIDGFLNMLCAARDRHVKRFVYAASSSTYGDHPGLPKVEDRIGAPLSPYAVTKHVNEQYAAVFAATYGMQCVGLRYFNVFGRRQDPDGAYAAVIPKWTKAALLNDVIQVNGDGETSRDFCYVDNAVQANILAASATLDNQHEVFNVAVGDRTSLNELHVLIRTALEKELDQDVTPQIKHGDFRPGDVRHSLASIDKASSLLGYAPSHRLGDGIASAMPWYIDRFSP